MGVRRGGALALVLLALGVGGVAWGEEPGGLTDFPPPTERRRVEAVRVTEGPRVDGRLDDAQWELAAPASGFLQVEPKTGAPSALGTSVRVLFDDQGLYVAARLDDPLGPEGLRVAEVRRDFEEDSSDWFAVALDPVGDGRTAFVFQVNPYGFQRDMIVLEDTRFDPDWDTVWRVETSRDDQGWSAEFFIPFQSIRREEGSLTWGIQFVRSSRRLTELSGLSPWPRSFSPYRMTYAGALGGLGTAPPMSLELQVRPYALVRMEQSNGDPLRARPTVGGDVRWNPSTTSALDLTFNTDFAEADVDQRLVNLSRFSVFFPERRQFFLENAGVFQVGSSGSWQPFSLEPFFSRRIGLSDDGAPVPIDAAARFVLKDAKQVIGGLVARTRDTGALPATYFGVARYGRNVGEASRLGTMLVARVDESSGGAPEALNLVPSIDGLFRRGAFTTAGSVSASWTRAGDVDPGLGLGAHLNATLQLSSMTVAADAFAVTRDFEARTGFVSRSDVLATRPWLQLDSRPAWLPSGIRSIRSLVLGFTAHRASDGAFQEASVLLQPLNVVFETGDELWLQTERSWQSLDEPFSPLDGVLIEPGSYAYQTFGGGVSTERSRKVSGSLSVTGGRFYSRPWLEAAAELSVQPTPFLSWSAEYQLNRFFADEGRPGVDSHLLSSSARLSLGPRFSVVGSYQRDTAGDAQLVHARMQWEYAPLSFLTLVLTDTRGTRPATPERLEQQVVLKVSHTWRP